MRFVLVSLVAALACAPAPDEPAAAPKPNIVILLADDLGFNDVSFHGGAIATPNIDRIANEGARLERYYVHPVCSPTRAGLLTGRYPIRYGAMRAVFPPWRKGGLDPSETTLADALARAGYEHRGVFGKWHLGHSNVQYHPLRRGFTEFLGHYNGAIDYFTHEREGVLDWHTNYETNRNEGYTTDLIADAAVDFVERHADDASPFLLYVPFNAPHSPFQAKQEHLPLYEDLAAVEGEWPGDEARRLGNRRILGAMVHSLDEGVGRILDVIDERGLADRTLVLFSSDNGGVAGIGENAPLRGAKASVFEGGIRVAAAARWPGVIEAGSTVEAPLANIDVLPTLLEIAEIEHEGKPLDGRSMLPALKGETPEDRELFNYIGQQGPLEEQISMATNEWKMVVTGPVITDEAADDSLRRRFLFEISADPNETRNVAEEYPERTAEMTAKLKAFRALQPADAVPPYYEGRDDPAFKPPAEWKMPGK